MFGFFKRQPQREYTLLARYRTGHWLRRFTVTAPSAYEAARKFDTSAEGQHWTRVSGATLYNEV